MQKKELVTGAAAIVLMFVVFKAGQDAQRKAMPLHWEGLAKIEQFDKSGHKKWGTFAHNTLSQAGESLLLDGFFRTGTLPTTFYLRLYNTTPSKTNGLADISSYEPAANGYAPQNVTKDNTGWPTLALDSGDYKLTSAQVTFTATGGSWGPVTYLVLATTSNNTGTLFSFLPLSTARTLQNGDTLKVTYYEKFTTT